jgi:hypothetical protein
LPSSFFERAGPDNTSGLVQCQNCPLDDSIENVSVFPQAQYLFSKPHKSGLSVTQLEAIFGQLEEDLWRKGGQSIGEVLKIHSMDWRSSAWSRTRPIENAAQMWPIKNAAQMWPIENVTHRECTLSKMQPTENVTHQVMVYQPPRMEPIENADHRGLQPRFMQHDAERPPTNQHFGIQCS